MATSGPVDLFEFVFDRPSDDRTTSFPTQRVLVSGSLNAGPKLFKENEKHTRKRWLLSELLSPSEKRRAC